VGVSVAAKASGNPVIQIPSRRRMGFLPENMMMKNPVPAALPAPVAISFSNLSGNKIIQGLDQICAP